MRLLTLLRHGKSDWDADYATDFDRPLKARGRRDVPEMGECFARMDLVPDLIVSSPAVRARQTAELFADASGYHQAIRWEDSVYAASSGELMSVLRRLPDHAEHVLLIGHNPGFEDLAARLVGSNAYGMALGLRLPTAAAAHLSLAVDYWRDVQANTGQLQWLITPKVMRKLVE